MSEEHLPGLSSCGHLGEPPKRKRTPSQYATHIADFKNVHLSPYRTSDSIPDDNAAFALLNKPNNPRTGEGTINQNHCCALFPQVRPITSLYQCQQGRLLPQSHKDAS